MFKVIILTLLCSILAGSDTGELGVKIERNVPVPMRDGTILRADVYRPDRGGPYPVLVRLGAVDSAQGSGIAPFAMAGYIVVEQALSYEPEPGGEWDFQHLERRNAEYSYDAVEWAAKLHGSTHKVGTFGRSHTAQPQWLVAPLRPPSLVAMSARSITAHRYHITPTGTPRPYTTLSVFFTTYAPLSRLLGNKPGVHTSWEAIKLWNAGEWKKWIYFEPRLDIPQEFWGGSADTAKNLFKSPEWDVSNLAEGCKGISVPNFDIVGWFDFGNNHMLLFRTMVSEARTEVARKGSKIIIGPWMHGRPVRKVGSIDFGPDAVLDESALVIRWFDYWLKGEENGVDKDAPVRIFVMGDNKWRDEQNWPLRRTKEKTLYIVSEGNANTPGGDGMLVNKMPQQLDADEYVYDPRDPVLTLFNPRRYYCPVDQRPLADRQDILVYQSMPLTERIEVTGNPVVELYAASSAPDTDWFVRLIDVAPDGVAVNVSSGAVRARYREGFDKPKFLKPREVVKYSIRMRPTSNAFLPGHRIRLDITSSDFPNYDRNHNTAADLNTDATWVVANQVVYHGGVQATRIILPWVPNPVKKEKPLEEEKPKEVEKAEPEPERQTYPLNQAAANGDIEQVRMSISKGVDINAKDEEGNTPLRLAVKSGKMEIVQILVEAGADVNMGSWPPLGEAVDKNDVAIAKYLIDHGANVNAPRDWTPLVQAPYVSNNVEMVELLIANGADVNAGEWSPLHGAVDERRRDIVELLIKKGADVNAKDGSGSTPLRYSIQNNDWDMFKLLFANGADIKAITPEGLTLLHFMSTYDNPDIIEWLLAKGAKVDERDDNYEFTALHYAVRFGTTKVAEVLIANGADIKAKDKWDYQPIHWAAYHDRADIVELLIAKGADVNTKTSLGQTPLDLAIPRRNTKTIEVLNKQSNKNTTLDKPYVVLERGHVRAVIVNNEPVDDEVLPGHRGGYSGVASLTHRARDKNLFVPFYAGLNYEHIHDGTVKPRDILFEPRRAPMEIRRIDEYTAELYQPPTPHWQLESWLRYQLLDDGVIEMMLECIPRARTFKNDYIGLFFASYIDKPESLDIHFLGRPADQSDAEPRWIRGVTPEHGKLPTHLAIDDNRNFAHDPNFPLTLVFNKSNYRYTEPWYYGVSHGMALVLMFRPGDNVRLSQSPSGGGKGNPAWDFQWFVPQYKVGQRYRFVMRAMYLPFESRQQIVRATARNRAALKR